MSEPAAQTTTPPRRPIIEMVQNIRTRVFSQPGQAQVTPGPQGLGFGVVQRLSRLRTAPGSTQLTGSEDFLIGLGVGVLAVVVIGALTFEIWAPRVAARLGKAAVTGAVGALPGAGAKGLLGFGILQLPMAGGRRGGTQIMSGPLGGGKIIEKIPRPLKALSGY